MSNAQTRAKKAGAKIAKTLASAPVKTSREMKVKAPVFNATQKTIVKLLGQASIAASSMKSLLLQAADLAKADLPTTKGLTNKERVAAVTKMYAVALTGLDDNAKGIFRNALTLHCVPDMPVEVLPAKGDTPPVIMKASEALKADISKHALTAAASAARESQGTANKKAVQKAEAKKPDVLTVGLLSQLPAIVNDKKAFDELKAALLKLGYKITANKSVAEVKTKPAFSDMVKTLTANKPDLSDLPPAPL
jgi:hypothetical protein